MKNSISKIIVRGAQGRMQGHLVLESDGIGGTVPVATRCYRLFKIGRAQRYLVTYTLDKKGPLVVIPGPITDRGWRRVARVINGEPEGEYRARHRFVCFLPKSWVGKRVRRTMRVLKEK